MAKSDKYSIDRFDLTSYSRFFDLKNLIVMAPLAIITVFCLSFIQMKALSSQKVMQQANDISKQSGSSEALPLITQPSLPTLDSSLETHAPLPVPTPNDPYLPNTHSKERVGPSSIHSGNALQPNSGNLNNNSDDELQATKKAIRFEQAKL